MVAYAFNAQQHKPEYGGAGGLPAGPNGEPVKYKVVISDSEQVATKDQQGGMLKLSIKCIEGPLTGVIQTDNLNLHNKSPIAVEIANKQLSAYCHVTGQFVIQDTAQLHNIPFIVEIRPQRNQPQYTEIAAIFDINGNKPGAAGGGSPVAQAPAAPPAQPPAQVQPSGPSPQWQPPVAAPAAPAAQAPVQQWSPPTGQPAPAPAPQQWQPPAQPAAAPVQPAAGAPAWPGQGAPPAWAQPQG